MSDPLASLQHAPLAHPPGLTRGQQRLVAVAEILLCSSIPTQIVLGALLRVGGWAPVDPGGQLSLPFVLILSIADTLLLIGLMVALTRAHGERVRGLWLGQRPVGREALLGALSIPVVFLTVVVLLNVLRITAPWLHNVPTNPLEQLAATPGQAAIFAVVAILAGGVREELQRAFLLQRFEQHLGGATVGVIVLSAGFGLGHIVQGWDAVVTTGLLGAFWAVLYLRRRSAVAPLVSHAGFNTLEIVRVVLVGSEQ
jgi:membrane protease YdiL (CAAX protease family)